MSLVRSSKVCLFDYITSDNLNVGHFLSLFKSDRERMFRAYCVGLPRSGTHSIATMYEDNYRASHEPYHSSAIKVLEKGKLNDDVFVNRYLVTRDRLLHLELESAHYLHRFTPQLVDLFPDAKFILTVREPKSWLESEFNKLLGAYKYKPGNIWYRYDKIKYGSYDYDFLSSNIQSISNTYPLKSMLAYYKEHIDTVLNAVPASKLLIVDTFQINSKIRDISDFLGTDINCINRQKMHSGKNKSKVPLSKFISESSLNQIIRNETFSFISERVPQLENYLK